MTCWVTTSHEPSVCLPASAPDFTTDHSCGLTAKPNATQAKHQQTTPLYATHSRFEETINSVPLSHLHFVGHTRICLCEAFPLHARPWTSISPAGLDAPRMLLSHRRG